jgi:hypothetical protein
VHDPSQAPILAAARRAGGRARHGRRIGETGDTPVVELATLADCLALLAATVNDARRLENSIARARCLGFLCGVWADCFETSELERRIAALEQQHGRST